MVVMFSDGMTEAEDERDHPFDESGLQRVVDGKGWSTAQELGWAAFEAVERHAGARRLIDDLTVLVLRRLPALPAIPA
jgi:serine phosphatase RsbU (regulator of sigma subunit)